MLVLGLRRPRTRQLRLPGLRRREVWPTRAGAMTGYVFDLTADELTRNAAVYAVLTDVEIKRAGKLARTAHDALRADLDPEQQAVADLIDSGACG